MSNSATTDVTSIENIPSSPLPLWSYLYDTPVATGDLRSEMADFKVFEQLPFTPCGEGEHVFIHIRKTGENTAFIARALAKYFQVKENLVSYAGLKDRFAVTEQWFAAHLPGKKAYDLKDFELEGVEVLQVKRHNKKLRIGALTGNRFELQLRNVNNVDDLARRWHAVLVHGVPNYFGEQRFGINGGNLDKALKLFSGTKVKDKKKRGMYLSAARSLLFNQVVSARIENKTFDTILDGDVLMLAGSQSVFINETNNDRADESLPKRLQEHDIDITAPMWGSGELMTQADAQTFENSTLAEFIDYREGLPRFGLKQERRKIRVTPTDGHFKTSVDKAGRTNVTLSFFLPAGCYATTVLRELLNYQDLTERQLSR